MQVIPQFYRGKSLEFPETPLKRYLSKCPRCETIVCSKRGYSHVKKCFRGSTETEEIVANADIKNNTKFAMLTCPIKPGRGNIMSLMENPNLFKDAIGVEEGDSLIDIKLDFLFNRRIDENPHMLDPFKSSLLYCCNELALLSSFSRKYPKLASFLSNMKLSLIKKYVYDKIRCTRTYRIVALFPILYLVYEKKPDMDINGVFKAIIPMCSTFVQCSGGRQPLLGHATRIKYLKTFKKELPQHLFMERVEIQIIPVHQEIDQYIESLISDKKNFRPFMPLNFQNREQFVPLKTLNKPARSNSTPRSRDCTFVDTRSLETNTTDAKSVCNENDAAASPPTTTSSCSADDEKEYESHTSESMKISAVMVEQPCQNESSLKRKREKSISPPSSSPTSYSTNEKSNMKLSASLYFPPNSRKRKKFFLHLLHESELLNPPRLCASGAVKPEDTVKRTTTANSTSIGTPPTTPLVVKKKKKKKLEHHEVVVVASPALSPHAAEKEGSSTTTTTTTTTISGGIENPRPSKKKNKGNDNIAMMSFSSSSREKQQSKVVLHQQLRLAMRSELGPHIKKILKSERFISMTDFGNFYRPGIIRYARTRSRLRAELKKMEAVVAAEIFLKGAGPSSEVCTDLTDIICID